MDTWIAHYSWVKIDIDLHSARLYHYTYHCFTDSVIYTNVWLALSISLCVMSGNFVLYQHEVP